MKSRKTVGVALCAPALMFVCATAQASGFMEWQRSVNWVPGSVSGGTQNNPGPGPGGAVWQYEWTEGGRLGSANPWYAQPTTLMVWDSAWYLTGQGVWSRGDNLNPPIFNNRLTHNVHTSVVDTIPLVRWRNPLGPLTDLNITGNLIVNWNGMEGLGRPVDVDVVIAKQNAQQSQTTLLFSTTVSKPNPFPSIGDSVVLPISLIDIELGADESIIISHRGRHGMDPGSWINLYDNLVFTAIPTPGTLGLLAAGAFAMARRRRN